MEISEFNKRLNKIMKRVTILQMVVLVIAYGILIYMSYLNLIFEQLYLIPAYVIALVCVVKYNDKLLKKLSKDADLS